MKQPSIELFKGFFASNGKKPKSNIKFNDDFMTFSEAQDCESFGGILKPEIVCVDVDDNGESDILFNIIMSKNIKSIVYETTRGKHFYFYNVNNKINTSKNHQTLCIGITADIKCGRVCSYTILKKDKVERDIILDNGLQELPEWLLPINGNLKVMKLVEGDGRNTTLYNSIPSLTKTLGDVETVKETIRIINDFVFSEPLPEKEIDTITRDDAFSEAVKPSFYDDNGKFRHDIFGDYFIKKYRVLNVDDVMHIYQNGVYIHELKLIEKLIMLEIVGITPAVRKNVVDYIEHMAPVAPPTMFLGKYIAFKNGLYDIEHKMFKGYDPNVIIFNKIPHNYNPEAKSDFIDHLLDKFCDYRDDIKQLVLEMFGYTFCPDNHYSKAFILKGDKSNGKSTILELMYNIHGYENASSLDISSVDDRFKAVKLYRKLVNIGDDINDDYLKGSQVAMFKKIATGDLITVEEKGQPAFSFRPTVKQVYSANNIPKMKDNGAALRRMCIIPCNHEFKETDSDYDPNIRDKLKDETAIEYMIYISIEGLKKLVSDNSFIKIPEVEKEIAEYQKGNDTITSWLNQYDDHTYPEIVNKRVDAVYGEYRNYCASGGYQHPFTRIEFVKRINKECGLKTEQIRTENNSKTQVFRKKVKE